MKNNYTFMSMGKKWEYIETGSRFIHHRADGKREIVFKKHPWWLNLYEDMEKSKETV